MVSSRPLEEQQQPLNALEIRKGSFSLTSFGVPWRAGNQGEGAVSLVPDLANARRVFVGEEGEKEE